MDDRVGGTEDVLNVFGGEVSIQYGFTKPRVCSVNRFHCAGIADVDLGRGRSNDGAYCKYTISNLPLRCVPRRRSVFLAGTATHHIFHGAGARTSVPSP